MHFASHFASRPPKIAIYHNNDSSELTPHGVQNYLWTLTKPGEIYDTKPLHVSPELFETGMIPRDL